MYFKVIMEGGHMGAGKSCEMVRYFEADNAMVLLMFLENYPGLKSKGQGRGITLVKPISRQEYDEGRAGEKIDPYGRRCNLRFDVREKCLLEPVHSGSAFSEPVSATTLDYSKGGIGVKHESDMITVESRWSVSVETLLIFRKEAEVTWVRFGEEESYAGLKWL